MVSYFDCEGLGESLFRAKVPPAKRSEIGYGDENGTRQSEIYNLSTLTATK